MHGGMRSDLALELFASFQVAAHLPVRCMLVALVALTKLYV